MSASWNPAVKAVRRVREMVALEDIVAAEVTRPAHPIAVETDLAIHHGTTAIMILSRMMVARWTSILMTYLFRSERK
jgi:hypothetical protein